MNSTYNMFSYLGSGTPVQEILKPSVLERSIGLEVQEQDEKSLLPAELTDSAVIRQMQAQVRDNFISQSTFLVPGMYTPSGSKVVTMAKRNTPARKGSKVPRKGGKGKSGGKSGNFITTPDGNSWNQASQTWPFTKRMADKGTYTICGEYNVPAVLTVAAAAVGFGNFYATIGGMPKIASISDVFDEYKITEIEVWCTLNPTLTATQAILSQANWLSVIDLDDETNLATYNAGMSYTTCVQTSQLECHYRRWRPHCSVATYNGAFSGFGTEPSPWINTASSSVRHYGLKFASTVNPAIGASPPVLNLTVRLHTQFRRVR